MIYFVILCYVIRIVLYYISIMLCYIMILYYVILCCIYYYYSDEVLDLQRSSLLGVKGEV